MKVGVIDYGVGNLGSLHRALDEVGSTPLLIDRALDLHNADALILPGVGSFFDCKHILDVGGWTKAIQEEVSAYKKPLLGICVGMQLLADFGEEGAPEGMLCAGLGFIPGRVINLRKLDCQNRLPHVGWNSVCKKENCTIFAGIPDATDFYFVHSYAFLPDCSSACLATVNYGVDFPAVVRNGKVWGTQFHPEKSSKAGLKVLKNFVTGESC